MTKSSGYRERDIYIHIYIHTYIHTYLRVRLSITSDMLYVNLYII